MTTRRSPALPALTVASLAAVGSRHRSRQSEKPPPRTYAYQALTAGLAFAASNMRRIVSFLKTQHDEATDTTPKQRTRRRTDEHGMPLPH